MNLTAQLKASCGYDWVMTRLDPVTPYGRDLARDPRWYEPGDEAALEAELDRISGLLGLLAEDRDRADRITHLLSEFHDIRGCLDRPGGSPMDEVELFEVKHFLLCLERLAAVGPLPCGLSVAPLTGPLDLLDPTSRRLAPFSVEPAFDPALYALRAEKRETEQALRRAEGAAREALLMRRQELVRQEDALELAVRRHLTAALLAQRADFHRAMDTVGRLDLVLAKARLARKYGCVRPVVSAGPVCSLSEMLHPQVAARLEEQGGSFTPVSIDLERGSTVITGANMGGKSVSLKTAVLDLLLMHTGYFVFAGAMSSPLFHAVHLICTDGQSVERGLSSFGAEMDALNRILQAEKGRRFFLALDEFARGTNPREGAALARALTQRLNQPDLTCWAMLTTHYDGVSEHARRHYQVSGLKDAPGSTLESLPRLMDYRLIPAPPGAPCPRDAWKVCRLLEMEPELLELFAKNI